MAEPTPAETRQARARFGTAISRARLPVAAAPLFGMPHATGWAPSPDLETVPDLATVGDTGGEPRGFVVGEPSQPLPSPETLPLRPLTETAGRARGPAPRQDRATPAPRPGPPRGREHVVRPHGYRLAAASPMRVTRPYLLPRRRTPLREPMAPLIAGRSGSIFPRPPVTGNRPGLYHLHLRFNGNSQGYGGQP